MTGYGDARAEPLLVQVMAEAGHHDGPECLRLLDEAESYLGPVLHKSRPDIEAARVAAAACDWARVWRAAYQAMCGLTWAWPPAQPLCPPVPDADPYPRNLVCGCGADLRGNENFCAMCGAPVARGATMH